MVVWVYACMCSSSIFINFRFIKNVDSINLNCSTITLVSNGNREEVSFTFIDLFELFKCT